MLQFLKGRKFRTFLLVICALLSGSVLAMVSDGASTPVSNAVSIVFTPVQKLADVVSDKVQDAGAYFRSSASYKNENERLKQKIAEYENQLAQYGDMAQKISSYETMLGVKEENPDFELCSADIIGTDDGDLFTTLIINKGSNHNVSAKDPVVMGNYLVGIVKKAYPSYSVVETILNPGINISAIESKTREVAYVTTDLEHVKNGLCLMESLDRTTSITPGGLVVTSGIGGLYPKGLIIGSVKEISESKFELSSYAVIEPGVEINEIEDVFVITAFEGQGIEEIID